MVSKIWWSRCLFTSRVWHLSFLIYWFSIKYKHFDTLCHYIFIRFIRLYVLLSYYSTSPSIFKIFGGIFIFSAFITFTAFSLISVLTQILFFPILTGIANTGNLTSLTSFVGIHSYHYLFVIDISVLCLTLPLWRYDSTRWY